ncbi:MAG TPA: potassium-transporting ATPase subunit KdpC [Actinomycetota bacterium]|nr:potassium-transporting ATPase subunit KdpC [Actinomycetota bacterium]
MIRNVIRAARATAVLAVVTGLIYPFLMTGIAQIAFHHEAEGSLIEVDGRSVGSALIGQQWTGPEWFYGRPSAISDPYDASTSSGSNLGPLSRELADEIRRRVNFILEVDGPYHPGLTASQIPVDLVTASASGLDPDITPSAAMFQAPRIAAVRGLALADVERLVDRLTEGRALGFLGEPRVNVLQLNLALDGLARG